MKKNSFFFIILLFCLQLYLPLSAEPLSQKGWIECEKLHTFLQKNDYNPQKLLISENDSASFPYNIILDPFEGKTFYPDDNNSETVTTLIFLFEIEEIQKNYALLKNILTNLENYSVNADIRFLFTYGDKTGFSTRNIISGAGKFADQISGTNNYAVICVKPAKYINSITTGGGGDCAPSWLLQLISQSLYDNGMFYIIKGGILSSLHRLNVLKTDPHTDIFISNGIPSCTVELISPEKSDIQPKKIANFIGCCASRFEPETSINWDRHSRPLIILGYPFILTENFTIILFIIVSCASLFIICEFSFINLINKRAYSRHIVKKWYILVICSLITTAAFFISQYIGLILIKLIKLDIISCYVIKIAAAFLAVSFSYFLILKLQGTHSARVFSFLVNISALLNIFIFTTLDLSLFYLFSTEYIIILFTQKIKKTISLSVLFILLCIPFIPYLMQFLMYSKTEAQYYVLKAPLALNLLFSLAFLPFELVWFRILARLNILWLQMDIKKKSFIRENCFAIGGAFALFTVSLLVIAVLIPDKYKASEKEKQDTVTEITSDDISINYSDEIFLGDTIRTFTVELQNPCANTKISVTGTEANPVLYTDEETEYLVEEKKVLFLVPAWAPQTMTFKYIADTNQDTQISVTTTSSEGSAILNKTSSVYIRAKNHEI